MHEIIACRFKELGCKSPAAAFVYAPEGCHCWKDPVQALCNQHVLTCESEGPITIILIEYPREFLED